MKDKPNVLLVFTDDQRFDTIAALGNEVVKTPNMDRLVKSGTAFTHAHIPSGTCGAVCCPSRAMLHTGRSLFHLQDVGQHIPEDHITMGEVFKREGYATFGCGKWHNGRPAFNRSFDEGEHIYFGGMTDHWNVPCYHYDPTGAYDATLLRCINDKRSRELEHRPADHLLAGVHSSDMLADCTSDWLRSRKREEPFFAYLSFLAPHDPRTMPEEFKAMYRPEDMELPPNFLGGHPFDTGALHIRDEMLEAFPRHPDKIKEHIAEYYAMITHLDHCLGRVLDTLEETGQMENTLIVFAGDNGLAVGQHGLMGKQNHYEHSIRVPLILSGPGVKANEVSENPVYLFDIFSSLCEHLGFEKPDSVEGESFAHELKGVRRLTRETLFFAYAYFQRSVKKGPYKYIEYAVDGKRNMTQLFDLEKDPWEMENLATEPEHRETCERLKAELVREAEAWDDEKSEYGEGFWKAYRA